MRAGAPIFSAGWVRFGLEAEVCVGPDQRLTTLPSLV